MPRMFSTNQNALPPLFGNVQCRTAPSFQSHPCPVVSRALSFPSPPVPWLGTPSQCCTPPGLTACLPALLGSQTARGGSGRPGGWDKDHMKFPTLPHPIRKQAERRRERVRLGGILWMSVDVQRGSRWLWGFHQLFRGVGGTGVPQRPGELWKGAWRCLNGLVLRSYRKKWSQSRMFMPFSRSDEWFQLFLSQYFYLHYTLKMLSD